MLITAASFIFSVLTFYTFYRFAVQKDKFFNDLLWLHLQWCTLYLASTLLVIYMANQVKREVNNLLHENQTK